MNKQEAFDIMWRGLKSQGFERSGRGPGDCSYRGANGRKCPVGWLIPDSEYDERWDEPDSETAIGDLEEVQRSIPGFTQELLPFLMECQATHDTCDLPEVMENNFRMIASKNKLTIPKTL